MKKIFTSLVFLATILFLISLANSHAKLVAAADCNIQIWGFPQDQHQIAQVPNSYTGNFNIHTPPLSNCFTVGGSYKLMAASQNHPASCSNYGDICSDVNVISATNITAPVAFFQSKEFATGQWTIQVCSKNWLGWVDCSALSASGLFDLVNTVPNAPTIDPASQPACYIQQSSGYSIVVNNLTVGQSYGWYFADECSLATCNSAATLGKGTRNCGFDPTGSNGIYCGGYATKDTFIANVTDNYTIVGNAHGITDQIAGDRLLCVDGFGQQRVGSNCITLHFMTPNTMPKDVSCNAPPPPPSGQTDCEKKYNGTCVDGSRGVPKCPSGERINTRGAAGCSDPTGVCCIPTCTTNANTNAACGTFPGDHYCCDTQGGDVSTKTQCYFPPNVPPTSNSGTCISCLGKGKQCNSSSPLGACCQNSNLLCASNGQINNTGICTTCIADNQSGSPDCNHGGVCCSAANDNLDHCTASGKCVAKCDTAKCSGDGDCCGGTKCSNGVCATNSNATPTPYAPSFPPVNWCPNSMCNTAVGSWSADPVKAIQTLFGLVLSLVGIVALSVIIYAGYRIMTSQGNPERLQAAREMLTAAIVGLLFSIFSLVILQTIGVDILHIPGFSN